MIFGFVSTYVRRFSGLDGVSLETEKVATVLLRMGHQVFYFAGELNPMLKGQECPEAHFTTPEAVDLYSKSFFTKDQENVSQKDLYRSIFKSAEHLLKQLNKFVDLFQIDVIVSQNSSSIPRQLSLGLAIAWLAHRKQVSVICHNHDFYWERDANACSHVSDLLDFAFPPGPLSNVKHLCISSIAQQNLLVRRGIFSHYLPNVFDFDNEPPAMDSYSASFRTSIGLDANDIIILQPTRCIERSLELVERLADPAVVLVITGDPHTADEETEYGETLMRQAKIMGIRCVWAHEWISDARGECNGHKVYTLWDVYPHCALVTYPSVVEGFGNALIEAVYFKKPLVVHRYAVFRADIGPAGIRAVEFYHDIADAVVQEVRELLKDSKKREEMVSHNYEVGKRCYSYTQLETVLREVIAGVADKA